MSSTMIFETLVKNLEWPSNEGRIKVRDMTTQHIQNALHNSYNYRGMSEYGGVLNCEWQELFLYELEQRQKAEAEAEARRVAEENKKLCRELKARAKQLELELNEVREQLQELPLFS